MLPWIRKNIFSKRTAISVLFMVVFLFATGLVFFKTNLALAQEADVFGANQLEGEVALAGTDIRVIVAKIIRATLGLLGIIALGIILYAGYTIMTSGGNEEKVAKGKKILINAIIGLVIILSAFSIAQFVLYRLGEATGMFDFSGRGRGGQAPEFLTYAGSGALGRIIRDHYPARDQENVPRNTMIAVTFAEAIDPESLIEDSNESGVFGDCVAVEATTVCDGLKTDVVKIYKTDTPDDLYSATVVTDYEEDGSAYTFVFRPTAFLGSDTEDVWQTVYLTNEIKKADGNNVFAEQRFDYYAWEFETGTEADFDPPYVVDVYPGKDETAPRNSLVQITFNEPMYPFSIDGLIDGPAEGSADDFSFILINSPDVASQPTGRWRATNNYRTAEFLSSLPCGVNNTCGEAMYCLPYDCAEGAEDCIEDYNVLVRTAALQPGGNNFQAMLNTGVMDMAGNALDNGQNGVADGIVAGPHKPLVPESPLSIGENEKAPDNYWWNFNVVKTIDITAPYIQKVSPGIDSQNVIGNADLKVNFSKRMAYSSFDGVVVEEHGNTEDLDNLAIWKQFETQGLEGELRKTILHIRHREFGPNNLDLYYFPQIPATIKGVNGNCLYPGRGPWEGSPTLGQESAECVYEVDNQGNPVAGTGANCVAVSTANAEQDTACVYTPNDTNSNPNILKSDVATCLETLRRADVSPIAPLE